jgi:hypothetical protein
MSLRTCGLFAVLLAITLAFPQGNKQEKKSPPEKKHECGPVQKPVTVYFCQKVAPPQAQVVAKIKAKASAMAPGVCAAQDACPKGKICKINHVILPNGPIGCNFGPAPRGACPKNVKLAWSCTANVTFDCHCK